MNRFFWRILLRIFLLQQIICFKINNATYSQHYVKFNEPKKKKSRLETVGFLNPNIFENYFPSNDKNNILTAILFVNFFSVCYLTGFMCITKDSCVWLRHEDCPSVTNNFVTNFSTLDLYWKAIFVLIGLFIFFTFPKIQIWMEKVPMLIAIDNFIKLEPIYQTTLKIVYKFVLSLEMQTKNKLALNTDVFSQLNDYRGWEKFWPQCFNKILHKNIRQPVKFCFIFFTMYLLETICEKFEKMLPDNQTFHDYFTDDIDSISVYNIVFILFKQIGFKIFSEWFIFVYLPQTFPFQFILTCIKKLYKYMMARFICSFLINHDNWWMHTLYFQNFPCEGALRKRVDINKIYCFMKFYDK